jgi:adenylyl- and sulfurtransferase ThiI
MNRKTCKRCGGEITQRDRESRSKFETRLFCSITCFRKHLVEKPWDFIHKDSTTSKRGRLFSPTDRTISFVPFCPVCFKKKSNDRICDACTMKLRREYGEGYEIIINSMFLWRQTHNPHYFHMYCLVYPNMKKHLDKTGKLKFSPSTT